MLLKKLRMKKKIILPGDKMIKPVLILGNDALYQKSMPVEQNEDITDIIADLQDTLADCRRNNMLALTAPQIGIKKRIIYMCIDEPIIFINPQLVFPIPDMQEVWTRSLSLPGLSVKVRRYEQCNIHFTDINGKKQIFYLQGKLASLMQQKYDYLEGILSTMRAVDSRAFSLIQF